MKKTKKNLTEFFDNDVKIPKFEYRILEKKKANGSIEYIAQYNQTNYMLGLGFDFEDILWSNIYVDTDGMKATEVNTLKFAKESIEKFKSEQITEVNVIKVKK